MTGTCFVSILIIAIISLILSYVNGYTTFIEGFGNLISLPFQGNCANEENTIFLNKYFEVYKNQITIFA